MLTRISVPFFFTASGYLYWIKERKPGNYVKRILLLYVIWSVIYLPFDISSLSQMPLLSILLRYCWYGTGHALWYLCASIIGFLIVYFLLKVFRPKMVLAISLVFLIAGCAVTTWLPMTERLLHIQITHEFEIRNGLTYGFPYIALGMSIAKSEHRGKTGKRGRLVLGWVISVLCFFVECVIFFLGFKTKEHILWLAVFPYTYFTFLLVNNIGNSIKKEKLRFLRKCSTLMYVSQYLFIPLFMKWLENIPLFIVTSVTVFLFSAIIIRLSETKYGRFLKYLY